MKSSPATLKTSKLPATSPHLTKIKSLLATLKTSKITTSSYTKQQMTSSFAEQTFKTTDPTLTWSFKQERVTMTWAPASPTLRIKEMTSSTLNPTTLHSSVIKLSSSSEPERSTSKVSTALLTVYATRSHPLGLPSSSKVHSAIKTTSTNSSLSSQFTRITAPSTVLAAISHSPKTASLTIRELVTYSSTIDTSTKETTNVENYESSSILLHLTSVSSVGASSKAEPVIATLIVSTSRLQFSDTMSLPASSTKAAPFITSSYTELIPTASEKSKLVLSSSRTKQLITSPSVTSSRPEFIEMTSSGDVFSTRLHSMAVLSLANTQTVTTTTTVSTSSSGITEISQPSVSQPTTSHFPEKSSPSNVEPVVTTTSVAKLISRVSESSSSNGSVKTKPAVASAEITSYHTGLASTATELSRAALTPSLNTTAVIATFMGASSSPPLRETTSSVTAHPTETHFPGTTSLLNQEELSIAATVVDIIRSQIRSETLLTTSSETAETLPSSFTQQELTTSEMRLIANEQADNEGKTYKTIGNVCVLKIKSLLKNILTTS